MRYLKDKGFVIRRINLRDCDKFVIIFTQNNGKIEVLAKGVRKINSRRAPHIELLNLIKFQAVKSLKTPILTEVEVIQVFKDTKRNLDRVSAAFLICELVDKLCPYGQKNENIFNLISESIKKMQKLEEESIAGILFDFQIKLLSFLGFWDPKKKFRDEQDLKNFIENIIERKIRTETFFKT